MNAVWCGVSLVIGVGVGIYAGQYMSTKGMWAPGLAPKV